MSRAMSMRLGIALLVLCVSACDALRFSVTPNLIAQGQTVTISWSTDTDLVSWCLISPLDVVVPPIGTRTDTPSASTRYDLVCNTGDANGRSYASDHVTVLSSTTPWVQVATGGPSERVEHAMAFDGTQVILFGGDAGAGPLSDTWSWNGASWDLETPGTSPPARSGHAMVFDGTGVVLFGGDDGSGPLADTWRWNGSNWSFLLPAHSPPARQGHALVYDGSQIVLFGGRGASGVLSDTWLFNGVDWTRLNVGIGAPSGRAQHGLVYDAALQNIILYGGEAIGLPFADLWVLRGERWYLNTIRSVRGRRMNHVMVYDGARTLTIGGEGPDTTLNDTWSSEEGYTVEIPFTGPGPRSGHAAAYDEAAGQVILFGGLNDATWVWTP